MSEVVLKIGYESILIYRKEGVISCGKDKRKELKVCGDLEES